MADGNGRSAEEREAARREREAAREERARRGAERDDAANAPERAAAEPESTREPEPDEIHVERQAEPVATPSAPPPLALESSPSPVRQPEVAGVSGRPVKTLPSPPDPDFYDDEEGADEDDLEVASGTRRVSRLTGSPTPKRKGRARAVRKRRGRTRAVKRKRRLGAPRKRRLGPSRERHSWLGRIASLIALALAGGLAWFLIALFQPFGTSPHGHVTVHIAARQSAGDIATELQHAKVIDSAFFFNLRATLAGDRSNLRSGTYHLQQGMSYHNVLAALTKVPVAAKTSQLTISEGHTREYVAALLRRQKVKGNYLAQTRHSPLLDPHDYGAPRRVGSLEGFLFPDTFTLVDPVKASALAANQLKDFKRRFAKVDLSAAHHMHMSAYDVLTVASLIEAESSTRRARPLVASVIYNRLKDHMMLQFDSTTRYATGNFTRPLKVSQLNSQSSYNTHTHLGLPPTPINSPSMASIQAAAHPAHSRYLYFFAKPCSSDTVFANNYAQFLGLLARDRRPHCH